MISGDNEELPFIPDNPAWPTEALTMREMINKLIEASPYMTPFVEDMLSRHPEFFQYETDSQGRESVASYKLANLVAACIMDFITWSYGKGHLGYNTGRSREGD